jgi:hypothetical protein
VLEGGSREKSLEYPDQEWYYFQMADRFGWTPQQVDELPAATADWLIAIAGTVEKLQADRINDKK